MNDINHRFKKGLIWSLIGQFGYLIVTLITNIVLARLLSPKEFGVMAVATFFIAIAKVLTESGLSGALIRKKDSTEVDNSTIFLFNLIVSVGLYVILYVCSPAIEVYYEIESLSLYLRVLGLILIINSFQIIQNVRLIKELQYKKISSYSLISVLIASFFAVGIGFMGFGVWALIILQLLNALILTFIYWFKEKGLSIYKFSRQSFKELYSFGLFTTFSSLLNTGFDNLYQLILGKYFSLGQTGYYFQAKKLSEIPIGMIKSTTLGVVFSALSNLQDNKEKFDQMYHNVVRIFTVIVGIICLIIFLYSKEILFILYGKKWIGADFYLKLLALSSFFYMQEMFNRILFKVFNQTHKIFILEIINKLINGISIVFGVYYKSIEILMYGYLFSCIFSYFINYAVSRNVYKSKIAHREMIYTFKVVLTVVLLILLFYGVDLLLELKFMYRLSYLPLIILGYLLMLSCFKVLSIREDINVIKSIKK